LVEVTLVGSRRKHALVGGINAAKIALGGDVEPDGIGDFRAEVAQQPLGGAAFVSVVKVLVVSFRECIRIKDVADIVKQSGCDQLGRGTLGLGKSCGLQCMLALGDGFRAIGKIATGVEGIQDGINDGIHGLGELKFGKIQAVKNLRSLIRGSIDAKQEMWVKFSSPVRSMVSSATARAKEWFSCASVRVRTLPGK
jgi:hypothetical protein